MAVLTILGAVFDKVYFPGVYLPKGGFEQRELDQEIDRIASLDGPHRSERFLPILQFARHVRTLDGFCVFTGDRENPFDASHEIPQQMLRDIYDAIHGPAPSNWTPMFMTNFHKVIPGSDEHVTYPGDYHYLAGAFLESTRTGIPLLCDIPGLPVPGLDGSSPVHDAKSLSAILAIECAKIALPEVPLLRPADLMEFRAENAALLRVFRRSMLRYAADLQGAIKDASVEEIQRATNFFVLTEIVPVLDELRASMDRPATPWWKRAVNFVRILPELGTNFMTMEPNVAIAKALATYAGQFFTEVIAEGDKREALKRSGLYYLLQLQAYQTEHAP